MHEVWELRYFLLGQLEEVAGHLPDGGIEADVQGLQSSHPPVLDDPLDLLAGEAGVVELDHLDHVDSGGEDVGAYLRQVVVAEVHFLQRRALGHQSTQNMSHKQEYEKAKSTW